MKKSDVLVILLFVGGCFLTGCKEENKPTTEISTAKKSKSLSELSEEGEPLQKQECEDKFKNEQGICEVPNHEHPEEVQQMKKSDNKN